MAMMGRQAQQGRPGQVVPTLLCKARLARQDRKGRKGRKGRPVPTAKTVPTVPTAVGPGKKSLRTFTQMAST
jgi:hypothetical protein